MTSCNEVSTRTGLPDVSRMRSREKASLMCSLYPCVPARKLMTASLAQWLRRPPRELKIPGSNLACAGIFTGWSHTSALKIGTPVASLPVDWVSAGTSWPGVSVLWLGEVESLIFNLYLSVAARKIVWADPLPRYTIACCWGVKQPTNNNNVN